jgi:tripartite-type tricarboxylate transporter receptor subunit TctC
MFKETVSGRAMKHSVLSLTTCLVALSTLAWDGGSRHAAADEVTFADKTINMTIGFAAGGGVDLYGRTIGKYITRHLPGNPSLVVQNQPGAGGVVALNDWPRKADPNGLSITIGAQSQSDPDALRQTHAKFDPSAFKMVGGLGAYSQGLFVKSDALARLYDKTAAPVIAGMVGSTLRGGTYQILWGASFLGWNVRWVRGYPSTAELRQAIERGEVEMATFGASNDFDYLLKTGKFTIISQTGQVQDGKRVSRPALGKAPIFSDMVGDKIKDPMARQVFSYWEDVSQIGMWMALPPTAPETIVDSYVKAFDATNGDASFRDEYSRIDPDWIVATKPDIERLVDRLAKVSPETLEYLGAELTRQGFTTGQ